MYGKRKYAHHVILARSKDGRQPDRPLGAEHRAQLARSVPHALSLGECEEFWPNEEARNRVPPRRGPARASSSPFLKCFRSACKSSGRVSLWWSSERVPRVYWRNKISPRKRLATSMYAAWRSHVSDYPELGRKGWRRCAYSTTARGVVAGG
jgi:hypothetical protein